MPDFLDQLARRIEAKADRFGGTFSDRANSLETEMRDLVRANWHPLPADTFRAPRRPACAVDSSINSADLVNGATLFVSQALCLGHGPTVYDGIECSRVEVEILPGATGEGKLKRFNDLLMQTLEVSVAREALARLPDGGVVYMDGALYSRLPQLYPLDIDGIDPLHLQIATDYLELFNVCRRQHRCIDLICVAKTSRTDQHTQIWAREAGLNVHAHLSDSEAIYRWTEGRAGFSTPVVLGHVSFSGGNDYVLTDTGLANAPAVVAFFVRLADYDDPLLVEFPAACLGHTGTLSNLEAQPLDMTRFDILPVLQTLASDYGGLEVYNALLYSVDREVRLKHSTMQEVYIPLVTRVIGYEVRLDRSDRRWY